MTYFSENRIGSVLHLTFEDASTRNSFSVAAARELRAVIDRLVKDQASQTAVEALVISARGRVFCSGGNLSDYASMSSAEEGMKVNDEIRAALAALSSLAIPTVCVVAGDCFGGGVEWVSCFDQVLAAPHVIFGLWQRKISLTYGWGGGSRLERRLGSARLRSLSLSARSIGAREAREIGLVDELVGESQLLEMALKRAHDLSHLPKEPVAGFKGFTIESEAELFNSLWWNETHQSILQPRRQ